MSCEAAFIKKLRERGFRMTPQREMVLAVLHEVEDFATAEAIHSRVQERSPVVDMSTVYRTLELLEDFQMVAHMDGPDGQRHYELLGIHGLHHHLHCRICGDVTPLPHEETQPLMKHLEHSYGFIVEPESWTFSGFCAVCRSARQS
ncbi:MAG: transcriptional repressor [Anaerolineae bacterium]|nr:transcriptional repressor [Anaerolineae bacterium]